MGRYRNLIRIEKVDGNNITCVVPGWNTKKKVVFKNVPDFVVQKPKDDKGIIRCFAVMNLDADKGANLKPDNWEI
jgi:hypothetical protein